MVNRYQKLFDIKAGRGKAKPGDVLYDARVAEGVTIAQYIYNTLHADEHHEVDRPQLDKRLISVIPIVSCTGDNFDLYLQESTRREINTYVNMLVRCKFETAAIRGTGTIDFSILIEVADPEVN